MPESARPLRNPIPATPEMLEQAKSLYRKNCLTCHGASGKGDGPAAQFVNPAPADLSSAEVQDRVTDGEIYWRVTEGLDPMPAFKKKLSDEERWKLVLHVRSLGKR